MSNAFTNYLSTRGDEIFRPWQHATKLYLEDNYAKAPKFGFIYFVSFQINENAIVDQQWKEQKNSRDVGFLVKKVDLPKFQISTETLNQYNRKTVVQKTINYQPVSMEFHDDASNISHNLWVNYYKHYFADSNYDVNNARGLYSQTGSGAFKDTKYGTKDYTYGLYNRDIQEPFFTAIDLYVLHQQQFTQYTLVNPKVTEWSHDSVNQAEGAKILQNRMNIAYENVVYKTGLVVREEAPEGFASLLYDYGPGPLAVAGVPQDYTRASTAFDQPGKSRVYGRVGGPYNSPNPLLNLGMILAKNYVNQKGLTRQKAVGYNIANGALGAVTSNPPGKYSSPPSTQDQPGIFNLPGGAQINIFKGFNTSVDGKTRANPASIIFPKG